MIGLADGPNWMRTMLIICACKRFSTRMVVRPGPKAMFASVITFSSLTRIPACLQTVSSIPLQKWSNLPRSQSYSSHLAFSTSRAASSKTVSLSSRPWSTPPSPTLLLLETSVRLSATTPSFAGLPYSKSPSKNWVRLHPKTKSARSSGLRTPCRKTSIWLSVSKPSGTSSG